MTLYRQLVWLALLVTAVATGTATTVAQEQLRRLPPITVTINEDILAAFVDEPCHHFEAARDQFVAGDLKQAADHLHTAAAFLRLEAARATPDGKAALDASIAEIGRLTLAVQNKQVESVQVLEQAFARAHYALASHHCIKSSHRCCRPATFQNKQELARAGLDLQAAAIHLGKGALWAGDELDEETRSLFADAQLTANQSIRQDSRSSSDVQRTIHALHRKLEKVSGLKIMLAQPPPPEENESGSSIFR